MICRSIALSSILESAKRGDWDWPTEIPYGASKKMLENTITAATIGVEALFIRFFSKREVRKAYSNEMCARLYWSQLKTTGRTFDYRVTAWLSGSPPFLQSRQESSLIRDISDFRLADYWPT
jgi:hypothetical protein